MVLFKFDLMRGGRLAVRVENYEACARCSLIDRANKVLAVVCHSGRSPGTSAVNQLPSLAVVTMLERDGGAMAKDGP